MNQQSQNKSGQIFFSLLLVLAFLLWSALTKAPDSNLHLFILDVGQGDAIFIQSPTQYQVLIDGGPDRKILSELSEVMPLNDRSINLVILTHNHADHLTGLLNVLERYQIDEVWGSGALYDTKTYQNWFSLLEKKGLKLKSVWQGVVQDMGGDAKLTVVYPLEDKTGDFPKSQHEDTVVSKLSYQKFSALLTGDIEEKQEELILKNNSEILKSDVLKIPHHGSSNGLLDDFLTKISPKLAIISVGGNNRYGHPGQLTLTKLEDRNIPILRTDQNGKVEVVSNGQEFWINKEK